MRRAAVALPCLLVAVGCGATRTAPPPPATGTTSLRTKAESSRPPSTPRPPFAVGLRVVRFVDHSRVIHIPGMPSGPRTLVTEVRYPKGKVGPLPLVIFGHGFAETPTPYAALLEAWARAGYVVAAPVFPLENANAPGGPNENDLVNQPRDMSFVISRLLAASGARVGVLAGRIDPREVAVAGQSDGGETALSVAYNRFFVDHRVRAAVILSGAKIPGVGGFTFPRPSPPLLATQGTADTINPPSFTSAFFDVAPSPKYLLTLFGAAHLGPYTDQQPQLGIVERVTIAFLDHYLKGKGSPRHILQAGAVPGTSAVQSST